MDSGKGASKAGSNDCAIESSHDGRKADPRQRNGGGILETFLPSSEDAITMSPKLKDEEGAKRNSTLATAFQQSQGRKRKGSLRKAAMAKMRERSSSSRKERIIETPVITTMMSTPPLDDTISSFFHHEHDPFEPSPESTWLPANDGTLSPSAASIDSLNRQEHQAPTLLASPTISSPEGPYISTTDEEETVSIHNLPLPSSGPSFNHNPQDPTMSISRRRSYRSEAIALVSTVPKPVEIDADDEDEWDYSETEWWGWVILIATWTVFVVVMGSCFGVWSWAWDVGETPYAPPDLEDDDTLPITGYYPALMVCTAVMSWVWVVVAWVGMKYFRHAKVVADDG